MRRIFFTVCVFLFTLFLSGKNLILKSIDEFQCYFVLSEKISEFSPKKATKNSFIAKNTNALVASTYTYNNTTTGTLNDQLSCSALLTRTFSVTDNVLITDLDLGINMEHTWRGDVRIQLTSPGGTTVTVVDFLGGDNFDDFDLLLDDDTGGTLRNGSNDNTASPNYGDDRTASPANALSAFDGENALGTWTLSVCNVDQGSSGGRVLTFNSARLVFDGNVPCPASGDAPVSVQGTCNGMIANNDATVSVNNIINADRADISTAGANPYDGDNYADAESVSGGTISFSGLEHGKSYIIRIYETGGGCFTDLTFVSADAPSACPNIPSDVPWAGSSCAGSNVILQNGIGALTCGVTTATPSADQWAFALMNFDDIIPASGKTDETSEAEVYHHPSWHIDSIGNVFGIAMNTATGDILISASSNYGAGFLGNDAIIRYGTIGGGTASGSNDSAAGGVVYKIDKNSGQASVFANLPQQSTTFINIDCESGETATRTNSGVGLGNIIYDQTNDQYFVTNIEDGRIYRLDNTGTILDSYDPFSNDDGLAGISDLEELVYGIAIEPGNTRRLFFGGIDNTSSNLGTAAAGSPGIYSITLNSSGGFPGTINNSTLPSGATYNNYEQVSETFHTNITIAGGPLPNFNSNSPQDLVYIISDLDFNANGELLAGVRTSCKNSFFSSYNHFAEVNVITKNTGTDIFNNSIEELDVSETGDYANEDVYGGVAAYVDTAGNDIIAVSSSDILSESGPHGIAIFNDPPNSG